MSQTKIQIWIGTSQYETTTYQYDNLQPLTKCSLIKLFPLVTTTTTTSNTNIVIGSRSYVYGSRQENGMSKAIVLYLTISSLVVLSTWKRINYKYWQLIKKMMMMIITYYCALISDTCQNDFGRIVPDFAPHPDPIEKCRIQNP